jgi:hypothetical protein
MRFLSRGLRGVTHCAAACLLLGLSFHCGGGGSSGVTLTQPGPLSVAYPHTSLLGTVGQSLAPDTPVVTGGSGTFTVSPTLPKGLNLDAANGTISGTPTLVSTQATYTVTLTASSRTAFAILQITVQAAGTIAFQTLACASQPQEHSEWCWAATGASLLNYLGAGPTQCAIVNYVRTITYACGNASFNWTEPVANRPIEALYGPAPSVTDLMAHFGKPCTGRAATLTFAEIQAEIGANRPFVINWAWTGGGGHILLGAGWDTRNGSPEVTIMDPWPGEGLKLVSYDFANSGSDPLEGSSTHTWRWSLTLNQ